MKPHEIKMYDDKITVQLYNKIRDKLKITICVLFGLKMTIRNPKINATGFHGSGKLEGKDGKN